MNKIISSRVLGYPQVIWAIIKNIPTLDPLVIIFNSKMLCFLSKEGKVISFVAIKKYPKFYELGTVYTFPSWRNKGYASLLIRYAIKLYRPIGLLCKRKMVSYYKKFGFKESAKCGAMINLRRKLFNFFLRPFLGYSIISMIHTRRPHTKSFIEISKKKS